MGAFGDFAQMYFDKGIDVIPVKGKIPFVKDWPNVDFSDCITRYAASNIGLKTGKYSNIIAIDIDAIDKEIQKKICALLPPIFSGKKGNPKKIGTYFFQYNGEKNEKIGGQVELLSTGNQTVLPPSKHPNFDLNFEWLGRGLLEIDTDDLPLLPKEFLPAVRSLLGKDTQTEEIIKSDGSRCNHNSHTKLSQMLVAKIMEGETIDTITKELLSYDENINPYISYFVCPSRKEWKTKDRNYNCLNFIMQGYKSHLNKGTISTVIITREEITFDFEEKKEKRKYKKLPHLRGIAQEMFEHVYNNSPIPRSQFAFASAISAMSVILGNKIRHKHIYPNLYTLMLAPSGFGKDAPLRFPQDLITASKVLRDMKLLGECHPSSDSAIMMNLPLQKVRIDIIDEADILFSAINDKRNSFLSKMADVYATLYTSTGRLFAGKNLATRKNDKNTMGNIGMCHSPYVTLLGAMTIAAFQDSFTPQTIEKGLGARFLYFIETKRKRARNVNASADVPMSFVNFAEMWQKQGPLLTLEAAEAVTVPQIDITDNASKQLDEYNDLLEKEKERIDLDCKAYSIYNRAFPTLVKIAQIDACSIDRYNVHPRLTKDSIDWAYNFVTVYLSNMHDFIEGNVSQNLVESRSNKVLEIIRNHPTGISRSHLTQRTRFLKSKERHEVLQDLIESGNIKKELLGASGKKSGLFKICN